MALPAVVLLAVLGIFPLLYSATLSFRRWDLQSRDKTYPFVGFENYGTRSGMRGSGEPCATPG
jgi:ABC-type sugar transport system permease subunit